MMEALPVSILIETIEELNLIVDLTEKTLGQILSVIYLGKQKELDLTTDKPANFVQPCLDIEIPTGEELEMLYRLYLKSLEEYQKIIKDIADFNFERRLNPDRYSAVAFLPKDVIAINLLIVKVKDFYI